MVLGKTVGKASRTLFFLSPDENPGHKPKVLFVLRLKVARGQLVLDLTTVHSSRVPQQHFCVGLRAGGALLRWWMLQRLQHRSEEQTCWKG